MSNSQLREGRDLLRAVRRKQIIQGAVEKLYLQRGGRALEKLIAIVDDTLDGAKRCREDDSRRLRENPKVTWRVKGERPLVSVPEQRLHVNLMLRYIDRKEEIMMQARLEINEVINASEPANDDELRTLLNALTEGLPAQTAKRDDALLRELLPQLSEADRREFVAALELNDSESIQAVLARQPVALRTRYGALAA